MKRLYLAAAVVGLWSGAPHAQEGLAPTAPVVPAPVLQNGKVQTPAGGGWGSGGSAFSAAKWSPFRNPATAGSVEPVSASYAPPAPYAPPLPVGITNPVAGDCGPGGCGGGRDRSCWAKVKALLCFSYSPAGAPKCQPTPFRTSVIGQFPCTSVGGVGCASGCAAPSAPISIPAPIQYGGPAMPAYNMPAPAMGAPAVGRAPQPSPTAGAVAMPARGAPSPVQPTWQGRVTPESAAAAKPAAAPAAPSGVVPTGFKYPAPAPNK